MSKHRTREQKIIAKLRRQLRYSHQSSPKRTVSSAVKPEPSQQYTQKPSAVEEKIITPSHFFSYDPRLIKKDLLKTVSLSAAFITLIFIIQRFFHL